MKTLIPMLFAVLMSQLVAAQEPAAMESGYIDTAALESVYGEPRVMINIEGMLLKFMAAATKDDPETAEMLQNLEGIRINVYSTGGKTGPAMAQMNEVKQLLQAQQWQPVVQVKEESEQVQIFVQADETGMQGLTLMAVDEEEAVFLNIRGDIDPSKLDKVMKQLNVDVNLEDEQ